MKDHLYTYKARIVKVVDGDTIVADIDLGFSVIIQKQVFRLARINAPELKAPTLLEALASKNALTLKLLGKDVTIKTKKDAKDKYGRFVSEVYDETGTNINDWLLSENLAKPYMS